MSTLERVRIALLPLDLRVREKSQLDSEQALRLAHVAHFTSLLATSSMAPTAPFNALPPFLPDLRSTLRR